jgi:hypothetical protein
MPCSGCHWPKTATVVAILFIRAVKGPMMFGRRRNAQDFTLEPLPDGLPKKGLFAEPVRVSRFTASHEPHGADGSRVIFLVEVRDAVDRRCSDVCVEVLISSPERARVVSGTTDLLGRIRFRIVGNDGVYTATVTNVGAYGLEWNDDESDVTITHVVNDPDVKADDD